ncbi:MAG: OadG family protein [Candidatus Aminicenantes bacterium]|nr:OadG family protein [Candidatus Aminicenantes bacterium]
MDKFNIAQGIEVTIIGVSVVFAGLILTFLMINLFSIFPRIFAFFKKKEGDRNRVRKISSPVEISKEHLAVIVTVLDIELKMRSLFDKGRFTFK